MCVTPGCGHPLLQHAFAPVPGQCIAPGCGCGAYRPDETRRTDG
jgi:hypothetical protein